MQVKKFEARTMKEALEMVKTQLGPDAIILSARDNKKSYGLVGEGSVEITAAVSEKTLHEKKFAESKLREQDLERFQKIPARQQKELIKKTVEKHTQKAQSPIPNGQRKYIDIDDDLEYLSSRTASSRSAPVPAPSLAAVTAQVQMTRPSAKPILAAENPEIIALKSEIANLKEVISQFQSMPQNFVGTHPGADYGITYDLSFMFGKLIAAGVAPEITAEMLQEAQETLPVIKLKNKSLVEAWVARKVLDATVVSSMPTRGKVHCFLGPAGGGKTSALIKMASHMVMREKKKVAIFTTDTFKVGAADQLKIYAQILNVPFSVIRNEFDWAHLVKHLANVDCALVDYAGLSLKNQEEVQVLMRLMPPAGLNPMAHLTLSSNTKDGDATELGRRYSVIGYQDVIFTSLDESSQHGTIFNFMKRFGVPLHSFGIGSRVPEDFEFATKERLLDLIFKITQIKQQDVEKV